MVFTTHEETMKKMLYRAHNITVIKKLWKLIKRDYGEPLVSGPYDTNNIYKVLKMCLIINREYDYKQESVNKHAIKVNNRTGIPIGYLCGNIMIMISGFDYDEEKLKRVYDCRDLIRDKKDEIEDTLQNISEEERKELAKKIYMLKGQERKKYNAQREEMKECKRVVTDYNEALDRALSALKKVDVSKIEDKELYKLLYFLYYSKKFDEYSVATLNDVIKFMERTGFDKLQSMGKDTLQTYRQQLEKQMQLVDAIFVIQGDKN